MASLNAARKRVNKTGQAVVEIALITPILLAALYIVADFGIAFMMGNVVATAARDGARIGSGIVKNSGTGVDFTATEATKVKDAIQGQIPSYLTAPRQVIVTFYEDDAGGPCWESIQVEVRGNYNFTLYRMMNLLGFSTPSSVTISRTTRMRYNFQQFNLTTMCTNPKLSQTYTL